SSSRTTTCLATVSTSPPGLEEIAAPADICISGAVLDQIDGKVSFPMSGLGERRLKNIRRPVVIYRVDWRLEDAEATGVLGGELALPDKSSVAVLPFVNMSGDAEQEYFADGITEDIITALSRNRWFFVIAQLDVHLQGPRRRREAGRP
ncbi:MAG: hypothetical protein ACREGK_16030, partial [Geminicoccales bacterium]